METTMNAVVEKRIAAKLQKGLNNSQTAFKRLQEEGKISRDFIFQVGAEKKGIETLINFRPDDASRVTADFRIPEVGMQNFKVNQHAIKQVAEKLAIPGVYLTALLYGKEEWQRTLAYSIMNTHNGYTDRSKVLIRAVGDEVRAFLSDQYRRLDSQQIFNAHVEEIFANGGQLSDGYMDDTRISIESLLPYPIEIKTELNGTVMLAFGTRLATSDYGDGALELRSFVLQGVCLNGMVRESVLRAIHLGAKLGDNLALSQHTYELDSMTTASAIRDLTKNLYSSDIIKERKLEVEVAAGIKVDFGRELKNLAGRLFKGETEEIGKILMRNDPMDGVQGESTLFKLTQGITAYANREEVPARRRMELQEIAGGLFNGITNK
jgi:hypothetical protein